MLLKKHFNDKSLKLETRTALPQFWLSRWIRSSWRGRGVALLNVCLIRCREWSCRKIARSSTRHNTTERGMQIGALWSSSFWWFLFSGISGRAKAFHRFRPPLPHSVAPTKARKTVSIRNAPDARARAHTRARADALFGHYYRCYTHWFFQLHARWSSRSCPVTRQTLQPWR